MKKYKNNEFYQMIDYILTNEEFQKLKEIDHHGITRYEHSLRVSYYTYLITSFLHLNYQEATRAALLHDFFTDEVVDENVFFRLWKHPEVALKNAKKYFSLTELEENIIKSHMFPVNVTVPRYLESWVVDLVDDFSAVYEKTFSLHKQISSAVMFLFLFLVQYIRMR